VQCCIDMTMPVARLMTDRLDQGAAQVEMAAPPADPRGARGAVRGGYAASPGTAGAVGHVAAAVRRPAGGALMRVVQFRACGGPEVLKWGEDPDPRAGQRRIRVAVRAAGPNPVDRKTFAGTMSGGQRGDLREADRG
jgi:hypothetical protein